MSAAANLVRRVILILINDTSISAVTFSFPFKQILRFSLNTVTSYVEPFLLQNMAQQPHIATQVFSLITPISTDAAKHKLISKAVIPTEVLAATGEGSMENNLG